VLVGDASLAPSSSIVPGTTVRLINEVRLNGQVIPAGSVVTVSGDAMKVVLPDGTSWMGSYAKLTQPPLALTYVDNTGLSFRIDLAQHLAGPDGFTKRGELYGTHSLSNALSELATTSNPSYTLTQTSSPGIIMMDYSYTKADGSVFTSKRPKTVYDPAIYSDQVMLDLAQQAGAKGWSMYLQNPAQTGPTVTVGGIRFQVYINHDANGNPFVGNVHPIK
jgi:hypothetical protein